MADWGGGTVIDVEPAQAGKVASKSSAAADIRPIGEAFVSGRGVWCLFFVVVVGRGIEEVYLGSLPSVRPWSAAPVRAGAGASLAMPH